MFVARRRTDMMGFAALNPFYALSGYQPLASQAQARITHSLPPKS
jgi:hypothetical protein